MLKRAMYGLKQAPELWQAPEPVLSLFPRKCMYYVGDRLAWRNPYHTKTSLNNSQPQVQGQVKPQTSLNVQGTRQRLNGESADITMPSEYVNDMLKRFGMQNAKHSPITGTSAKSSHVPQTPNTADHKEHMKPV